MPFEPPAVRLLPDGHTWVDFFHAAMAHATDLHASEQIHANLAYWFEHELRQYPATNPDPDRLAATADRIVPAAGRDSDGYPCREATVGLGKRLGRQVIDLPGGHVGAMTHPAEFATPPDPHRPRSLTTQAGHQVRKAPSGMPRP